MPKGYGYNTGGKKEPKGLAAHGGHATSMAVDITHGGAGMGTAMNPNAKMGTPPPGKGSKGTKSNSTPSS